jgi:hypothetical protein
MTSDDEIITINGLSILKIFVIGLTSLCTLLLLGTGGVGYVNDIPQAIPISFIYSPLALIISLIICAEIRYLSIPKTPLKKDETITERVISEKITSFLGIGWIILTFYNIVSSIFIIWLLIQNAMPSIKESIPQLIVYIESIALFLGAFIGIYLFLYLYIKVNALKYKGYKK